MKKEKVHIYTQDGIQIIDAYTDQIKIKTGETVKIGIHRPYKYPDSINWYVSERSTGTLIVGIPQTTREKAKQEAIRYRNDRLPEGMRIAEVIENTLKKNK